MGTVWIPTASLVALLLSCYGSLAQVYKVYDFDANQRTMILNTHNALRATEPAKDMQEMVWDSNLASMARYWAGQCSGSHSPGPTRHDRFGYDKVGETIWWSNEVFLRPNLDSVVKSWYSEKTSYTFESRSCRAGDCGHYTQVVWASSCAVGCAAAYCGSIKNGGNIPTGHVVVCNYGPGGNIQGHDPYMYGRRCEACPVTCTTTGLCPSSCSGSRAVAAAPSPAATPPSPPPPPSSVPAARTKCVDHNVYCGSWAEAKECEKNPRWMNSNCFASCNKQKCVSTAGGVVKQ